ncbi:MAG: hypothetical protein R3A12_11685 [Ignavibacteria bacterium]
MNLIFPFIKNSRIGENSPAVVTINGYDNFDIGIDNWSRMHISSR